MGAPFVVSEATVFRANTSGTTAVVARPDGAQTGDVVVIGVRTNGTNSPTDWSGPGFVRRGSAFVPNNPAGRVIGLFLRVIEDIATEPTTYTLTKSQADTRRAAAAILVRGVDLENMIAGNSSGYDAAASPRIQLNSFALSGMEVPALMIGLWGAEVVSPNATQPTIISGTSRAVVGSLDPSDPNPTGSTRTVLVMSTEELSASPTGHKSTTFTSASGASATGFALRGKVTETLPDPEPGLYSVEQALAIPGLTWAHRGGSTTWPEMSEYAYDQAVLRNYPILEFSAQKTADHVWFGSHDDNLNRVAQTTGLPAISTQSWAQVQALQNKLNAGSTPRPFYRLDAFLDKYTPDRVVVVDPKNAIGYLNDGPFLDLLDAHGGPSKIIVKFFGVGSGAVALANRARARGYQTWGYFYESDIANGNLARDQSAWTILGMEIGASQSAWDTILAYGKPVVGHIAGSQADYNTAIAKGARMVQTAAVASVAAVAGTGNVQPWDGVRVGDRLVDAVYVGTQKIWP